MLHKTISFVMALVVLVSTLSFTVESHYCGGHLVDSAIFTKVKNCGTSAYQTTPNVKKSCCKDVIEVLEGVDHLKLNSFNDLDFDLQNFIIVFVASNFQLFESLPKQIIPHKNYNPPNLVKDYQVLHDVYII